MLGSCCPGTATREWAEEHRQPLRQTYLSLLLSSPALYEERAEYDSAVEVLRRVVAEEPTREEAHVGLMRLYALLGSNGEALAQYERLEEALLRELGTEPTASSRALREEIVSGRFPPKEAPSLGSLPEEALGTGKHNLPAPRTSFIGREQELAEVKRAGHDAPFDPHGRGRIGQDAASPRSGQGPSWTLSARRVARRASCALGG